MMSSDELSDREAAHTQVCTSQPPVTDAEMPKLKRYVGRRQYTFDEIAKRYALQFNLGDFRAPIPKEMLSKLKPLEAAEISVLTTVVVGLTVIRAGEGLSPEAISEMFSHDGLERWVATGNKPLIDVKSVVHTVVNWINTRGLACSIKRRLTLASSGEEVDSGPYIDLDDPQAVRELTDVLKGRWTGQVAAWQTAPNQVGTDSTSSSPKGHSQEAAPSTEPRTDGEPAATHNRAAPAPDNDLPPDPLVILGESDEEPIVCGVLKKRLTIAQYDVVKALLAAGNGGLSKDSLAKKSGHGDAHRVLKRLNDSDSDWKSVIQLAGRPGGRYRIRMTNLPTSPEKRPLNATRGDVVWLLAGAIMPGETCDATNLC
jgi:hypothetical protein